MRLILGLTPDVLMWTVNQVRFTRRVRTLPAQSSSLIIWVEEDPSRRSRTVFSSPLDRRCASFLSISSYPDIYSFRQGTHGYLVTREGALKLLALCPKAVFHIDLDVSTFIFCCLLFRLDTYCHSVSGMEAQELEDRYVPPRSGQHSLICSYSADSKCSM